jgi:hypothetical protein
MVNKIPKGKPRYSVNVDVFLIMEGDYWVAVAPAVWVSGYGKTQAEARKAFAVELDIFIDETEKRGTLERLLIEYGWTLSRQSFVPPVVLAPEFEGAKAPTSFRGRVPLPAYAWAN